MVVSLELAAKIGVKRSKMFPVDEELIVSCSTPMEVLGGMLVKLVLSPNSRGKWAM